MGEYAVIAVVLILVAIHRLHKPGRSDCCQGRRISNGSVGDTGKEAR